MNEDTGLKLELHGLMQRYGMGDVEDRDIAVKEILSIIEKRRNDDKREMIMKINVNGDMGLDESMKYNYGCPVGDAYWAAVEDMRIIINKIINQL